MAEKRTNLARSAPANPTAPAWYDVTWNPTVGCSPVGPGCDHCDAMRIVAQLARMGGQSGARYAGLTLGDRSDLEWSGELRVRDDLLTWPLVQRRPRRILVGSLSDVFHEALATETIDAVHAVMRLAHWHRFLLLTRRAKRMRAYYTDPQTPQRVAARVEKLTSAALRGAIRRGPAVDAARRDPPRQDRWPLRNLLAGVSVEDQQRADRIGELLQTPAALRWACFEPLLGPVQTDFVPLGEAGYVDALSRRRFDFDWRGRSVAVAGPALPVLDWVVAGGETGVGARPTIPNWIRDLRDACVAAGVRFFFKQWGEWGPAPGDASGQEVVRCGRRTAGRLIDGRSWDELPPQLRRSTRQPARRAPR